MSFSKFAVGALALVGGTQAQSLRASGPGRNLQKVTDADVLNFALNLECLEAEFYSWAAYGHGLSEADRGYGPNSTGGAKAQLSDLMQIYAEEIARNEIAHVRLLRAALGDSAVECPYMDVDQAFVVAANAAFNTTLPFPFSPYASDDWFALGAFIFEDVGVTAYKGAAPLLSDRDILETAAGILAVEAYHAGFIRSYLVKNAQQILTPYGVNISDAANAISALRAAVGGGAETPLLVNSTYSVVPADTNAVAFSRSPAEVLAIVYLGNASQPFGFFPNGVNGVIA